MNDIVNDVVDDVKCTPMAEKGPWLALFDYEKRSPMTHNARVIRIPLKGLNK